MCVNEKIELFMAMRIRLAAAEAERKGLHYVASTCCYGARASSPQPPVHGCIPACPPSCPRPHGARMESRASTGLDTVCPNMGVLLPALCLLFPRTGLEVIPNLPAFQSRTSSAM